MSNILFALYFVVICVCINNVYSQRPYEIPEATVELLSPQGFSVSIPDQPGIRLFAFHGKLNEPFTARSDGGYYSSDIIEPQNGRWTYTNRNTILKIGDVLHYWLFVDYSNLGRVSDFMKFIITDQDTIDLFAFRGKISEESSGKIVATFSKEKVTPINGKWVFDNEDTKLKPGDMLCYGLYVAHEHEQTSIRNQTTESTTAKNECTPTSTTASKAEGLLCSGNLIFQDNFDGPNIDSEKWIIQQYIPLTSDDDHHEFVSYQTKNENIFIKSSILYLKPTPVKTRSEVFGTLDLSQGCTKDNSCIYAQVGGHILPPVVSAKILSKMSFKYGKIQIRAKMPLGDWIYPQIELIPKNSPLYPRMLVAYTRGNEKLTLKNGEDLGNTLLFGGPVATKNEPERSSNLKSHRLPVPLSKDMHTFTLSWSPTQIDLMVDSDIYGTLHSNKYSGFNEEFRIALGVGVGGHFDFPDDVISGNYQKPWANFAPRAMKDFFNKRNLWNKTWQGDDVALQIDYIKVWAI